MWAWFHNAAEILGARTDDGEVPAVQGGDFGDTQALGQRNDGGIGGSERQIGVLFYEFGDPRVVLGNQVDRFEVAVGHTLEEPGFHVCVTVVVEEVTNLSRDGRR